MQRRQALLQSLGGVVEVGELAVKGPEPVAQLADLPPQLVDIGRELVLGRRQPLRGAGQLGDGDRQLVQVVEGPCE